MSKQTRTPAGPADGELFERTPTGHVLRVHQDGLRWQIEGRDPEGEHVVMLDGSVGPEDPRIEQSYSSLGHITDADLRDHASKATVALLDARGAYQGMLR